MNMRLLAPDDIFAGYPNHPNILPEHRRNAELLCVRVNHVLQRFVTAGNAPLTASPVTQTLVSVRGGGWRPPQASGAPGSAHKWAGAVDLHDPEARLDKWLVRNPEVLEEEDLYMEDPSATEGQVTKGGWCHLALFKGGQKRGGKRIFLP